MFNFTSVVTEWSKMYRDLYSKAHSEFVEHWTKAEQKIEDSFKIVWWKN